jgi:hypothetical protein
MKSPENIKGPEKMDKPKVEHNECSFCGGPSIYATFGDGHEAGICLNANCQYGRINNKYEALINAVYGTVSKDAPYWKSWGISPEEAAKWKAVWEGEAEQEKKE